MTITLNNHGFINGEHVQIADNGLTFTCAHDGNASNHTYPRATDPISGKWMTISNVQTNTFDIQVLDTIPSTNITTHAFVSAVTGCLKRAVISTGGDYAHTFVTAASNAVSYTPQSAHTFVSADFGAVKKVKDVHTWVNTATTNWITVLDYNTSDCTDVQTTIENLINILQDTLTAAKAETPTDHLGSLTKVSPPYEFLGGRVDTFYEVPFPVSYHDATNDIIITNQIDADTQYRFRDAAELIRANSGPIVDKASADMLTRYPDLAIDMPRNSDGSGAGTLQCKTDLALLLNEFVKDIENGGNFHTVNVGKFYLGTNDILLHIRLQVFQSVYAHERLGFYMKQAITGDLDYTNTDDIIVGDWGITDNSGSGNCANVQTAIDTLITTVNDIIAPTNADYAIAADRLYFNRQYVADECVGSTTAEFTYTLNNVNFQAFNYPGGIPGQNKCKRDLKFIMLGVISDLQTGGTNSTISAIEKYITSLGQLDYIETELLATTYAIESIKDFGAKAIRNLLYDKGSTGLSSGQYAAVYSDETAFRDALSPTNIDAVVERMNTLVTTAVNMLSPARLVGRKSGKNMLYNTGYYKEEIQNIINTQFGAGTWDSDYANWLEDLVNDIVHDTVSTDISDSAHAYDIVIKDVVGAFIVGEQVSSSGGGTSKVLEYNSDTKFLVVGAFTGGTWKDQDFLTGMTSNAQAEVSTGGIGLPYTWYNTPSNVKIIDNARLTTSNVAGTLSGANLFTNPEVFATNWTGTESTFTDDALVAPDNTTTADKIVPSNTNDTHTIHRNYNLNSYETFDTDTVKFDSSTETFDTGAIDIDATTQQFTFSTFLKAGESTSARVQIALDEGTAGVQRILFDANLTAGTVGTLFTPQLGITGNAYGLIPYGDGWYRAYITCTFSFGFSELRAQVFVNNASGQQAYAGNGTDGLYVWGAKLIKNVLDPYTAVSGQVFYADSEFNVKNYAMDLLETYLGQSLDDTLTSPSPSAGYYKFFDTAAASNYEKPSITRLIRHYLNIIREQLKVDTYYTNIVTVSGITVPTPTYGTRDEIFGVGGGLRNADFVYGLQSNNYAEIEAIAENSAKVVQIYKRFRIDGTITDGPFTMNETVQKQGTPGTTGVVYGFHEDANYKYVDVRVTAGTWAITDTIQGSANTTLAQISAIEDRMHVIDLKGTFTNDVPFKGYTSSATAQPTGFLKAEASITNNTGGTLTVDTEGLLGSFETTSVVYPSASRQYIEVSKYAGLDIAVGDRIASAGYIRLGISVISSLNEFTQGNRVYKVVSGTQDLNTWGVITEVDIANNFVYIIEQEGTFSNGDVIGDYGNSNFPVGYASISTKVTTAGAAAAVIQDVKTVGVNQRLYLSGIKGTFDDKDAIIGPDGYKSVVVGKVDLKARVKRSFKGFDGTQTTFKLTRENGTQYLPDPEGHMLIFINGILQPPGGTNAYTAFSDQIQFTEAPELGASFTGFYVGKLRQLDDISFDFDSLRQSFNLKRNNVFYSLTLTEGVQSSTIRPENNIICSLNGVIQEPGVGFEIVGSRIIFSEIPRVGSTFVAFSYVGSEADVDAAEVVPPIEPGDFVDIQGETADREVAVIESSNSLITFDYLGSVFGKDAQGQAAITSGTIEKVQVTFGGSGYTTRPNVRVDSISGFEGNIRALVGVAGVTVSNPGTGYQDPTVAVETVVPDNWTAPDLSLYGEEEVAPN